MLTKQLNYKHLRYFHVIAKEGSIVKAADYLNVSPQTISGQLSTFEDYLGVVLFERNGKRLILNDAGKLVLSYAEDIFSLGAELQDALTMKNPSQKLLFTVGVVDIVPKVLASNIVQKCFELDEDVKVICREGNFDSLVADLALNKLDVMLSDRPLPSDSSIKAFNHELGETSVSFYVAPAQADNLINNFPASLNDYPFLIYGDKSSQKIMLQSWFEEQGINPVIVAEFDDSALIKYFGQSGYGAFCTPSIIEDHVVNQFGVTKIGQSEQLKERFYAISLDRKVKHPGVKLIVDEAQRIFAGC